MATVTSKGQVTLPKRVRDALGARPGSEIEFDLEEGRAVIRKHLPLESFAQWEGMLRGKLQGGSVDETMEMMRGERLRDEER